MAKQKRRMQPNPPYVPFNVYDFLGGCIGSGMSIEEIGFYQLFLCLHWQAQAPIPCDVLAIAARLKESTKVVRRLLNQVILRGEKKITLKDGQLFNPRMMREIRKYQHRRAQRDGEGQVPLNLPPVPLKIPVVRNPIPKISTERGRRSGKTLRLADLNRS